MTSIWGPPTWNFLHTFANKISDEFFQSNHVKIVNMIVNLFYCLPCRICSSHSIKYIKTINLNNIRIKQQLIDFLFNFHNNVNSKLNKPIYNENDLQIYSTYQLHNVFNKFSYYIQRIRGHDFFNDTNKRDCSNQFQEFIQTNISHFN